MSNNTKKNDHFYLLHRGKTWALKDATKEELDAIRDLFKNDTAKNLNKLYLLTDKVWNTVIKHYANAKSDPSANVSPAVILKHYFKSFDLSQGVQWLDWTVKNPTYTEWNGANAVFALEESAKTEAGDDTEPESDGDDTNDNVDDSRCPIFNKSIESYLSQSQSGEDSTHAQGIPTTFLSTAKQRNVTFDDETIIITKETTEQEAQNTQHDDNHNINNGNSGSDGTNLQSGMVQKDTEDDDLKKIIAAENWLHLANVHVTKLQELVARNGPENCSTYKLTFGAELIKLLIYEKLGVGEPYRTWLRKIWPGSTDEIFGNLMNKLIPANRRWLIANGYLSENEIQLKTFVCRANELGGINLNMNLSNKRSKNIDEPRNSKRRRLNETVPLNNLSLTNTTINHSNQNPSNSNLNVSRPSPITPSNPLAITSMDDLKKALQTDEVKKLFLSLHNIPPTTTNNSSVSNPSTSNNANLPTDNSSGSTASKQIDSIQNQLNQLTAMIKNQMPQSNASNPNKNHVALTYSKPERGWNTITVDKNEMGSMLTRVQNITNGTAIDPQLQGVITSMNLETNKQLCKKLDGMYYILALTY